MPPVITTPAPLEFGIGNLVDLPDKFGDSTGSQAPTAMGVQVRQADDADGQCVRHWAALDGLHGR